MRLINPSLALILSFAAFGGGASMAAEKPTGPAGGADAAPVQMLVPGFAARELPVQLKAINNVRYRSDGKLVALGYDGKIYLLSDTDGDGLEDKADVFYDPGRQILSLNIALTPPGYKHGDGVFIARKGSLVLVVDSDGDDKSDKEIVVAKDWETPKRFPGGASDAIGVAVDAEGNIFFGLGAANSQNGYLLENGKAGYNLTGERGTIMRIPPDFSRREIVATGVRASVGLAFNAAGDLFATDQEGATWMPNGNPFDELIHIEQARHYGFPPRHPKHLPQVIDEPVFDYGPQHQSTCGLQFNEPFKGGPVFGPSWWQGDALVAGEARGKIYRTKLIKTAAGYVGQNQIIACLSWLTIDQCVSPKGDLLVTVHDGPPDWGNGPGAIGRLFKITRVEPDTAQPVLAYAAGPTELNVAFDRPVTEAALKGIEKRVNLTEGWFVREGDLFESFRPGYRAVSLQKTAPRTSIKVLRVETSEDRQTLVITTEPRKKALNCAIDVSDWPLSKANRPSSELPQKSVLSLAADLSGVTAEWTSKDGAVKWNGWLPHADLEVARGLTAASAGRWRLWELLKQPGTLTLRGQFDLWNMLRPTVQPGERLDYTLPPERVSIGISGPEGTRVTASGHASLKNITAKKEVWVPFEITLPTGSGATALQVTWSTADDARPRAFALRRMLVPWAVPAEEPIQTSKLQAFAR